MFSKTSTPTNSGLLHSRLYAESTFYHKFKQDLLQSKDEVIIESPYITAGRMKDFRPVFNKILKKGVKIYIFTRDPREHEGAMAYQAEVEIQNFERAGIQTFLCTGNHHRKLAIIDRNILWEGSLNILSQAYSREIMRRIEGQELAVETFNFLKLGRFI
jgi:phosphatidylserine/phosphatidylglycerophosphate/cardiolipin synthase-like enzyme